MPLFKHILSSSLHFIFEEERKDAITGENFKEGDEVVCCAACKSIFLYESWAYMNFRHCQQEDTLAQIPFPKTIQIKEKDVEDGIFLLERKYSAYYNEVPHYLKNSSKKMLFKYLFRKVLLSLSPFLFNALYTIFLAFLFYSCNQVVYERNDIISSLFNGLWMAVVSIHLLKSIPWIKNKINKNDSTIEFFDTGFIINQFWQKESILLKHIEKVEYYPKTDFSYLILYPKEGDKAYRIDLGEQDVSIFTILGHWSFFISCQVVSSSHQALYSQWLEYANKRTGGCIEWRIEKMNLF